MTETQRIIEALGGTRGLRRKPSSPDELRDRVRQGLPYSSLEALVSRLEMPPAEAASVLHLSARTLVRRKKEGKLRADESDRVLRLARVAARAAEVLGTVDRAAAWLRRPNRALGLEVPLQLLDTDIGARQVEDVLGRIEHGIAS